MATDLQTAPAGTELPRGTERLCVLALAVAAFACNLNVNVLGALLPFLRRLEIVDVDGAYLLVMVGAFGTAAGALTVGAMARRLGRKGALLAGLALFSVASVLHLWAGSLLALAILRVAAGLAAGLAYAAASALAAEVAPYSRRGAAMGWFAAGMFLAVPVGMPLAVWLARHGEWRAIFAAQAAIGCAAGLVALRAVPALAQLPRHARWREVLAVPGVRAGLGATMLHVGSFFIVVQLATTWLDETGRVAKEEQVMLWVLLGLLSVVGSASLGRLADRAGKRAFVLACSVVLVLGFVLLARQPGPLVMLWLAAALAVTAAARTGPLQALVSGLVASHQLSALMGLRSAGMQLGAGLFALVAGPVAVAFGFPGVLWLAAGCQVASYGAIRLGVRLR